MKFSTVAKVAVEIADLKAENAKLRGFVQNVANEKGTPTTWGTVYREAQEMVTNANTNP